MLNLVSPSNSLLVQYKDSLTSTSYGVIPKKVTFKAIEGTSTDSQVVKKKSKSKPIVVVDKDVTTMTVTEKSWKSGSKKVMNVATDKTGKYGSNKEVPIISIKVVQEDVKDVCIPEIVVRKSKKLNTKSKFSGVVMKDATEEKAQQNRKHKILGVFKQIKKVRSLTNKDPFTKATTTSRTFEVDHDSKETKMQFLGMPISLSMFHLERMPLLIKYQRASIPDVTINTFVMDTNIGSSEQTITSIPEKTIVFLSPMWRRVGLQTSLRIYLIRAQMIV